MNERDLTSASKFLSLVLRHKPETIGLKLDEAGWTDVEELLAACARHGKRLTREGLDRIVAENDKKRFAFSDDGQRIRASQGHSVKVDLGYSPAEPPETLYHGTAPQFLDSIRAEGLRAGQRHHVHLSRDRETASRVGQRRGKPVILCVAAGRMHREGHAFFISANGVWLTETVPPSYLSEDK
jgi:putative RNA 2'-phosphotransferase